jgi:hypothetical protein
MSADHEVEDVVRATTVVYPLSGDQDTNQLTLRVAGGHDEWLALDALTGRFVRPPTVTTSQSSQTSSKKSPDCLKR